jgi:hypothetical protein
MRMFLTRISPLILLVLLLSLGVTQAASSASEKKSSSSPSRLNGGYYLLHHVSEDESGVHMLFMVKDAPAEISKFADRISKTADETLASLGRFQDKDASINFEQNPLPSIENDVRASIRDDKEHQLLFGTTGTEFIRAFLVTQIDASNYALNLSKVLAEQETNPRRAKVLRQISAHWLERRDEAFRLLRNY